MQRFRHIYQGRLRHGRVVVLAVMLAGLGSTMAAAQTTADASCNSEVSAFKQHMIDFLQTQNSQGGFPPESDPLFESYPLVATLALDIYRSDQDQSFLRDVFDGSNRYIQYLFATADQDGDFLLERNSWDGAYISDEPLEDAGFNAMLALEVAGVSRIAIELGLPIEALFWYQGHKTVARQLVQQMYDGNAQFFLPTNGINQRQNLVFSMAVLGAVFADEIGDNVSAAIIRNQLLATGASQPETPLHSVDWDYAAERLYGGVRAPDLMRAALLLSVLDNRGFNDDASRLAEKLSRQIQSRSETQNLHADPTRTVESNYLVCLLANNRFSHLLKPIYGIELLTSLTTLNGVLQPKERAQLESAVVNLRSFVAPRSDEAQQIDDIEQSVRQVYWTVSALRKKWRDRTLFTPRHREQIPGFDVYAATDDLLKQVINDLHRIETRITDEKARTIGFDLNVTLQNELAIAGDRLNFQVRAASLGEAIALHSIVLTHEQKRDTLMSADPPVELLPGESAKTYTYQLTPENRPDGSVFPVRFTLDVRLSNGQHLRYHMTRGAYVVTPVTYALNYPRGMILTGGTVPIELQLIKHVDKQFVINAEWYSPAGLVLGEGRSFETFIPANQDSAKLVMNVQVPTPCRPGTFPFLLKVYANGEDKGVLRGSLFKHYQWVFVGPFPKRTDAINASYPPEQAINLRESYPGAIRPISWFSPPRHIYKHNGELDLTALLPQESVGYMYTVVHTPMAKRTSATFYATAPAVIFINGNEVARFADSTYENPQRSSVYMAEGMNNILIKLLSADSKRLFFQIGDEEDLSSDAFNNNLWELVDGYKDFYERSQSRYTDAQEVQQIVTLSYKDPNVNSVAVIGTFNGWSAVNASMHSLGDGKWEISLHLPPGRYAYRFLINSSNQVLDPEADFREPDGYGGENSVLFVR